MTFDNSKTIINIRIKLFGATITFLAFIVLTYIAKMINYPLFGMSDTFWTVLFVGIYLVIVFLPMFLNYQFIFYSDDSDRIIIRYFTAGIVDGRKNSIEIDKRTLSGYKTKSRLFGLIQSIILFQKYNEKVAEYPKIYISALSRKERAKIIKSFNSYTPQA